jgi:hypothetical protein
MAAILLALVACAFIGALAFAFRALSVVKPRPLRFRLAIGRLLNVVVEMQSAHNVSTIASQASLHLPFCSPASPITRATSNRRQGWKAPLWHTL